MKIMKKDKWFRKEVLFPKNWEKRLKKAASEQYISVNALILRAVAEKYIEKK